MEDRELLMKMHSEMKEGFALISARLEAQEKVIQEIKKRLDARETLNGQQDVVLARLQERVADIEERLEEERKEKRFWKGTIAGLFINAFLTWLKMFFRQ